MIGRIIAFIVGGIWGIITARMGMTLPVALYFALAGYITCYFFYNVVQSFVKSTKTIKAVEQATRESVLASFEKSAYEAVRRSTNIHPTKVRIGDVERYQIIDELIEHFEYGRITLDEYKERCEDALKAVNGHDLMVLIQDLPVTKSNYPPDAPYKRSTMLYDPQ